ncbi:VOC family protein [Arthrobacter sp. NA-172]|uniref:VOC family protein n=1 Tax=Arthrobacter sp. NA-172 TaxID=3367524 RepID=UPI003754B30E
MDTVSELSYAEVDRLSAFLRRLLMGVPVWHLGLAVQSLSEAMDEFTAILGTEWRPIRTRRLTITDAEGVAHEIDCEVTFSAGGPFALELWQSIPGTPLEAPPGGIVHHIGIWTEDVHVEGIRLQNLGYPTFAKVGETPLLQQGPGGLLLELCDLHSDRPSLRDLFPSHSPHAGPAVLDSAL